MTSGRRRTWLGAPSDILAAIAVGGALGALARFTLGHAWPTAQAGFPWATFVVNAAGCFAIGVLLVTLAEGSGPPHRLARPFLGTGVLGGFTTFSAYAVEAERLLTAGAVGTAFAYVFGTLAVALLAAQGGVLVARASSRAAARRRAAAAGSADARTHRSRRSR